MVMASLESNGEIKESQASTGPSLNDGMGWPRSLVVHTAGYPKTGQSFQVR
jgi:hypothetical protein